MEGSKLRNRIISIICLCVLGFFGIWMLMFSIGIIAMTYQDTFLSEDKAEDKKEYIVSAHNTVPINRLISDYDANEMRADELYEGKLLRVSGIVSDIRSSDIAGNPYVLIKSPEIFAPVIKCVFKDSNRLLKYSEGDKITVIGICTGLTVDGLVIYFDQCEDVVMP